MSFVNNIYNLFGIKNTPPRVFPPKDDVPKKIYDSIDWNKSCVAGSYALKQFSGDSNWEPNDIDIMIACGDKDEFIKEATAFEKKTGCHLVKHSWFDELNTHDTGMDELFHERVIGSRTYQLENYNKTIQLICLNNKSSTITKDLSLPHPTPQLYTFGLSFPKTFQKLTPQQILNETTDVPSCVSYTIHNNQKIFTIPEKGRESILTKRTEHKNICKSRLQKYTERGYFFY